jgi:hypothetical protein
MPWVGLLGSITEHFPWVVSPMMAQSVGPVPHVCTAAHCAFGNVVAEHTSL